MLPPRTPPPCRCNWRHSLRRVCAPSPTLCQVAAHAQEARYLVGEAPLPSANLTRQPLAVKLGCDSLQGALTGLESQEGME